MGQVATRNVTLGDGTLAVIRHAMPDDATAVIECERDYLSTSEFLHLEPDEFPTNEPQERQRIQAQLDSPTGLLLLAQVEKQIVSTLVCRGYPQRRRAHVVSFGMGVRKSHQRLGIGRAMIDTLLTRPVADAVSPSPH
ncbi:MAG: GNAT family N-acetyltransferase [Tepidisphaeraceae bacterium]